jgi:hypothetical protein
MADKKTNGTMNENADKNGKEQITECDLRITKKQIYVCS